MEQFARLISKELLSTLVVYKPIETFRCVKGRYQILDTSPIHTSNGPDMKLILRRNDERLCTMLVSTLLKSELDDSTDYDHLGEHVKFNEDFVLPNEFIVTGVSSKNVSELILIIKIEEL